ncbi:MAG TPA: NAD(P)-binding domain-containing protein [Longimicrobium sp.]|nr:NAD(P)-binding domain-containing protein [Longimicrobium sp.]
MNIALIGTGDMGGALALAFSRHHRVTVTASRPGSESARQVIDASGGRIHEAPRGEAVAEADLVVLAVPWEAVDDALADGLPDGKILLVVTVPWVGENALAVGTTTSGAEEVAARVPGARVVQAFNTVASATVAAPAAHGAPATVIVCGDDAGAKVVVADLARELGFDVANAGPLTSARFTEPMGMLWSALAYEGGYGEDVAFRVLRRNDAGPGDDARNREESAAHTAR